MAKAPKPDACVPFPLSIRYVARVILEFNTPFHLGTGGEGEITDAPVVTDCNGLPALPGSGLAGVLRDAFAQHIGENPTVGDQTRSVFGFPGKAQPGDAYPKGQGSRLRISWACIHDSRGQPVEGIATPERLADPVLTNALAPRLRDHVRINHRGTADGRGKFDELVVCAGHRFTFEMELVGEDDGSWDTLLQLLVHGGLRLGGKTRRGFGAFKIIALHARRFDLTQEEDFSAYSKHPVSLAAPEKDWQLEDRAVEKPKMEARHIVIELPLQPSGYWMFGAGEDEMNADMAPVCERRIQWTNSQGRLSEEMFLIPASAVKGAIAHRVAFHYNAAQGRWADDATVDQIEKMSGSNNEAVKSLFGYAKGTEDGSRGCVIIDDMLIPKDGRQRQFINHVAIDRFTGGAMTESGALFNERPIWKGDPITLRLQMTVKGASDDAVLPAAVGALRSALADLCEGRLQLGGGSGRGNGYFDIVGGVDAKDRALKPLTEWIALNPEFQTTAQTDEKVVHP